jgi:predicted lipid-binding transport protein (Tim44 family)
MRSPFRLGSLAAREYQANQEGLRTLFAALILVLLVGVVALLALRWADGSRSKVQGPKSKVQIPRSSKAPPPQSLHPFERSCFA